MVRVLIVDDSAFMRNALSRMLSSDSEITVVGTAKDGLEAIEKVVSLKPDVVTMDVEMPRMDGVTALRHIMEQNPLPVIMVSSLTDKGAKVTLDALDLGAVDFIPKNLSDLSINIVRIQEDLLEKIGHFGRKGLPLRHRKPVQAPASAATESVARPCHATGVRRVGIVTIGTSTGGPKALQEIIPRLPVNFPVPVVVAQHMPPNFTKYFADRLNQLSRIRVKEAEEGDRLEPGTVMIAPGRGHMRIKKRGIEVTVTISEDPGEFIYRPSVDALFLSASEIYSDRSLGVILTGMGNDGLKGSTALKQAGGRVFAQNEETCVVYGMPKAVIEGGLADKVLPVEQIAGEIVNTV